MQLLTETHVENAIPFLESFSFLKTLDVSSKINLSPNSHISRADASGMHFEITCSKTPVTKKFYWWICDWVINMPRNRNSLATVAEAHCPHGDDTRPANVYSFTESYTEHRIFDIYYLRWNLRLTICPANLYLVTTKSSAIVFSTSLSSAISQTTILIWLEWDGAGCLLLVGQFRQFDDLDVSHVTMTFIT